MIFYILLFFNTLSTENLFGNDHEMITFDDHDILIRDYLESDKQYVDPIEYKIYQVVIYDFDGNIIRQFDLKGNIKFKTPVILLPMIHKSQFLIEIDGVYYYLYQENIEVEKKFT